MEAEHPPLGNYDDAVNCKTLESTQVMEVTNNLWTRDVGTLLQSPSLLLNFRKFTNTEKSSKADFMRYVERNTLQNTFAVSDWLLANNITNSGN